jgi:outer membrane lipoprotein-sorting protein
VRNEDPIGDIVASMLKAYGGAESVKKVISVTAKGRIVEYLDGKAGNYVRYFERPGKLRIEVMPEQGGEIGILNGDRDWQWGSEGFTLVSPIELQSMIYQYSYLDLPMGLAKGDYQVKYGGKQLHNGHETYLLLIETKNAPQLRVLVDTQTSLISRVAARFAMGMMGANELATDYSDFHPVGGVLFPHKLTNYAGDMKLSEIMLNEITINREIPLKLFTPQ